MANILIMGTGYVGLTTGACLSELGHEVTCIDKDATKINILKSNQVPIYEPNLIDIIHKNVTSGKLKFSTDLKKYLNQVDIVFLAVGTPSKSDGSADLEYIYQAFDEIIDHLDKDIYIVIKSTVPVNTNSNLQKKYNDRSKYRIDIISNPEFLREGYAVEDFFNPTRIVVGINNEQSKNIINNIYQYFLDKDIRIIYTDPNSAEIAKYACNTFLATKVAFINEMADLCEFYNADVEYVAQIMGLDDRIGHKFLKVGPGFGGYCFPKDVAALKYSADTARVSNKIVTAVINSNHDRIENMAEKIKNIVKKNSQLTIFGASFKAGTDDVRKSPAIHIISKLISYGFTINLYDPAALDNAREIFQDDIKYFTDIKASSINSDAVIILTEWQEFIDFNYREIYDCINSKIIIDFRNILDAKLMIDNGFEYHSLGKNHAKPNQ